MTIDYPTEAVGLRQLWKEAFGDSDAFLDIFFNHGYSRRRCRCITDGGTVAAALYWFDCSFDGQKIAYLYAVATAVSHRGQGLCRRLMADTHALLQAQGYAGAILVPGEDSLFRFYAAMGYQTIACVEQIRCTPAATAQPVAVLPADEYAARRRQLLRSRGVVQEGENLAFLETQAEFWAGADFILAARREEGRLFGLEFLGDTKAAPGIVAALGCREGIFRVPGAGRFAMFRPLREDCVIPHYFGFAFD